MGQITKKAILKLFEGLNKEQLVEFLVDYAGRDNEFANAVNVRFGVPEFKQELAKIEKKINRAFNGVSDYRRRGDWGYVYVNTEDIIAEIYERAEQGYVRLAFAELELLYRRLIENFEYQEECELSDKADDCLFIMSDIADKATLSEDKDFIFNKCIELAEIEDAKNYGADYEDKLLRISAKFINSENVSQLETALEQYESYKWRAEEFKLIRHEIIRKLEGDVSADKFIAKNLEFPKIREIAYDNAHSSNDFEQCEYLCMEALSIYEHRFGISPWLYKLFDTYKAMENKPEMSKTAKKILFSGNLKYYDILKALLKEQGIWECSYSALRDECKSNLCSSGYMEILEKEQEYDLLLEQLKTHMYEIYRYGKLLSDKFPDKVCSIFTSQINKEAESASGRESYKKVCSRIVLFAEAGYAPESNEMIWEFKLKYKRKPAFVDELAKIKSEL